MHFNERIIAFEQVGDAIPVQVQSDSNKRGAIRKQAKYRFVTTGTKLYVRFGGSSVTCANDGTEGYLLLPETEYILIPSRTDTFVAFSRAISQSTDNFVEVK